MKLRNKETGTVFDNCSVDIKNKWGAMNYNPPKTLKELNERFEDYEEPKSAINNVWFNSVIAGGHIVEIDFINDDEAIKAVEKLKAWKRLKDKGFRFTGFTHKDRGRLDELEIYCQLGERPEDIEDMEDVRLLFGGEE